MDLTIGVSTNRQKIGNLLDVNLEGWRAVGINEVGSDKVLLWVNLENDRSNATYDDGFISGLKFSNGNLKISRILIHQLFKAF